MHSYSSNNRFKLIMAEDNKQGESHTGLIAGITAALAAGAVYFYGDDGEEHRKKLRSWVLKTKGDILEQLEDAEEVSKEKYAEFVDKAVAKFAEERAEKEAEVELLRSELKGKWEVIKRQVEERGDELRAAAAKEITKQGEKLSKNIAPEEK